MYDTEVSFNKPNDQNSVVAIFDNQTLLDYNKIQTSEIGANELKIELVQLEELQVEGNEDMWNS